MYYIDVGLLIQVARDFSYIHWKNIEIVVIIQTEWSIFGPNEVYLG